MNTKTKQNIAPLQMLFFVCLSIIYPILSIKKYCIIINIMYQGTYDKKK